MCCPLEPWLSDSVDISSASSTSSMLQDVMIQRMNLVLRPISIITRVIVTVLKHSVFFIVYKE